MLINKALKVRIYPNKVQSEKIDATFGCCRYNSADVTTTVMDEYGTVTFG